MGVNYEEVIDPLLGEVTITNTDDDRLSEKLDIYQNLLKVTTHTKTGSEFDEAEISKFGTKIQSISNVYGTPNIQTITFDHGLKIVNKTDETTGDLISKEYIIQEDKVNFFEVKI